MRFVFQFVQEGRIRVKFWSPHEIPVFFWSETFVFGRPQGRSAAICFYIYSYTIAGLNLSLYVKPYCSCGPQWQWVQHPWFKQRLKKKKTASENKQRRDYCLKDTSGCLCVCFFIFISENKYMNFINFLLCLSQTNSVKDKEYLWGFCVVFFYSYKMITPTV